MIVPESILPKSLLSSATKNLIIGIDEAGRGPVLGPMVYSIFICSQDYDLRSLGAVDSKTIKSSQRLKFLSKVHNQEENCGWNTLAIHPTTISHLMLSKTKNLNEIAFETVFSLIDSLAIFHSSIKAGYVDTLGCPKKYKLKLQGRYPNIDWTVSKQADKIYPVVSAASIIAKLTRDEKLELMAKEIGFAPKEIGSGYPSDPITVKWLKQACDPNKGFPEIVRFSWSSAIRIMDDKSKKIEWKSKYLEAFETRIPKLL